MAGGISIHAVDVVSGKPAAGMRVVIQRLSPSPGIIAEGYLSTVGILDHPVKDGADTPPGVYEVLFMLGEFYSARGVACTFLTDVPFRFTIVAAEEHVHLPIKFSPWGYALFRGA